MAIKSVGNIWERRRSELKNGKYAHYLMYLAIADDPMDGPAAAINDPRIPNATTAYVDTAGNVATLSSLDCDPRQGSALHFEVMATFTQQSDTDPPDNPLLQPPTYSWSYENTTENYFQDNSTSDDTHLDGTTGPFIVATSAGEAFEQLPTRDKGWLVITMGRNEASHDAAGDDQYSNTVNQTAVLLDGTTYAPGTLKLSPIAATKNQKVLKSGQTITYYATTYQFKARHEGWDEKVNDVGMSESVGVKTNKNQNLRRIVDSNGNPITKPWPLDGKGSKMPNATDTPAVLVFKPYTKMDWSAFSFS